MALRLRDIFDEDVDSVFSYRTPRVILIKDYYLGCLALFINLMIFLYFVIYVIFVSKGYQQEEYTYGSPITFTSGTALSRMNDTVRIWDSIDLVYPMHDSKAIVLAFAISEIPYQTRGICRDPNRPCRTSDDCFSGFQCDEGFCDEPSWCNTRPMTNYTLEGVDNFLIWFQGYIEFVTLAPGKDMTTMDENKPKVAPEDGYNTVIVSDILSRAGVTLDEARESGAVIRVRTDWDCDITWSFGCSPDINIKRLDDIADGSPVGFRTQRVFNYKDADVDYRDIWYITGVRFVIEARGRAYAITVDQLILNLSSAIALTKITPLLVDFLMLNVMTRRRQYNQAKYVMTQDYEEAQQNGYDEVPQEEEGEELEEVGGDNNSQVES